MIQFDPASFKDPAGRVFYRAGWVYRTLTDIARDRLVAAEKTGLLAALSTAQLLVEGELVSSRDVGIVDADATDVLLRQRQIGFVSYSYEWSFEMLRDAALTTLRIMDQALAAGFILKDANAFNILFDGTLPRLVDLPSLEPHVDGQVWAGYNQFCRSFLFPLLLSSYRDLDIQALLRGTLGEVPVRLAASLFGLRDYRRPGVFKDVVLQARLERTFGKTTSAVKQATAAAQYPKVLLVANVRRLISLIERLQPPRGPSEWSGYDAECSYSPADRRDKLAFIERVLGTRRVERLVDLGCNTGAYSRAALERVKHVVAVDLDSRAIDGLYRAVRKSASISPIVANLLNPTPAMGWQLQERRSLLERLSSDCFLALALVHHLRITGGVPLTSIIQQLFAVAPEGVIEWVDKSDSQVESMLALRPDVYDDYEWATFVRLISEQGELLTVQPTHEGRRRLCHVRARCRDR